MVAPAVTQQIPDRFRAQFYFKPGGVAYARSLA